MDLSLAGIAAAFAQMSGWEILAVVFGIAYVLFAAKESLWTWLFAFLSDHREISSSSPFSPPDRHKIKPYTAMIM